MLTGGWVMWCYVIQLHVNFPAFVNKNKRGKGNSVVFGDLMAGRHCFQLVCLLVNINNFITPSGISVVEHRLLSWQRFHNAPMASILKHENCKRFKSISFAIGEGFFFFFYIMIERGIEMSKKISHDLKSFPKIFQK